MPYAIRSAGEGRYKVVNTETGAVHSKATTKPKAEAQVRLLRGVEHGMRPRTTRQAMGQPHFDSAGPKRHKPRRSSKPANRTGGSSGGHGRKK